MTTAIQKLVVIEDDPFVRDVLSDFAKAAEVELVCFSELDQIDVSSLVSSDLVLLDLHLGGQDGLDVISLFHQHNIDTPIVICSGMDDSIINASEDVIHDYGLVYGGQLAKPFTFDTFSDLLKLQEKKLRTVLGTTNYEFYQFSHSDLLTALEENWVEVFYQPQVNPLEKKLTGVECLARIRHPEHGLCTPNQFIAQIAQFGLMDAFTQQIIQQGLTGMAHSSLPDDIIMSFNIDPRSINDSFFDWLNHTVNSRNINPCSICLEVTELAGLDLSKEIKTILTKCRIRGYHLSLDDYGTGYGTIQELNELPFDELKIDRSFVISMDNKDTSLAIVRSTAEMAIGLNYRLIAEGVETKEQMRTLLDFGCVEMQGYLFSRPINLLALNEYIDECSNALNAQLEAVL